MTDVVVVRRGQLPRTSSGKVRRQECARRLRSGQLAVLARWPGGAAGTGRAATSGVRHADT
jgi:long-chain fatty acid adenylase/transferase FadD26